jgi:hypothetical protein
VPTRKTVLKASSDRKTHRKKTTGTKKKHMKDG